MTDAGRAVYLTAQEMIRKACSEGRMQESIFGSAPKWLAGYDEARAELIADGYVVNIRRDGDAMWLDVDWSNAYLEGFDDD